jgi:hypothetical protein
MVRIFRMKLIASSRFRADSKDFRPIQPPGSPQRWPLRARSATPDHLTSGLPDGEMSLHVFCEGRMFTGVKVFSATKAKERDDLGEQVTRWLRANADLEIVDRTVTQSSDNEFHCLTVVIFYKPRPKP